MDHYQLLLDALMSLKAIRKKDLEGIPSYPPFPHYADQAIEMIRLEIEDYYGDRRNTLLLRHDLSLLAKYSQTMHNEPFDSWRQKGGA